MTLVRTPAVILHAFKYSESSKIVRLATRELGVQSAIAKGALKPKSKFGARLQHLSEGVAQLYVKPHRELQTLSEFDVTEQHAALAREVRRYAVAAALAELVMRFAPSEPNAVIYEMLVTQLSRIARASDARLDGTGLSALWQIVAVLGFAPATDGCARDGRRLPDGAVAFSVADGGFLCARCAAGAEATRLKTEDRLTLEMLLTSNGELLEPLSPRHAAAHRRLLSRFVHRHVSENRELRAFSFWEAALQ